LSEVTQILSAIEEGNPAAACDLLPLVYDELRKLAAAHLAHEKPGQTLQPTALVHEAYLRLLGDDASRRWDSRGHFFVAAAEAMRRIMVENARRKRTAKRGGGRHRVEIDVAELSDSTDDKLVALDDALTRLAEQDATKANLVRLRYFAGLTTREAAEMLGLSTATADRYWAYARAWLQHEMSVNRE
jgi:RNA polymerase sigma factor (TIGR02999 family)